MIPYIDIPPIHLGPLTLHAFGILVASALLIGARVAIGFGVKDRGLDRALMADLVAWIAIGGMICGHMLQILFYRPKLLLTEPWMLFALWNGLSSFGGFIGATGGFWLWLRYRKIENGLPYADSISFGFVLGWIFGRMGCTTAHDHPGRLTDFFLGVRYPSGRRHDLGFDELLFAIGLFTLFLILRAIEHSRGRRFGDGTYVALMMVIYAPVRFCFDFLRATDLSGSDARYVGLTPAQYGTIVLFFGGVVMLKRAMSSDATANAAPDASATTSGPVKSDKKAKQPR